MTISTTKKLVGITAAAGLIFALAGCGSAPNSAASGTAGATAAVAGFKPCLVSDNGGFNDKSFNESAKNGMDKAAAELGVKPLEVESKSENDYKPNMDALLSGGCTFIVSVGFKLSAATVEAAKANPNVKFAIIDDMADVDQDGKTDATNIKPLLFDTAQAAYLGGYAAAAWSHASGVNKVGTFGGLQIPPVTIFMDGFVEGVKKFDADKGANVESFGWDAAAQKGSFTGDFKANDTAKQTAQGILDQGTDVILPVGGPIYLSASAAIKDSGKSTVMLGVDSDLAVADPSVADQILVSIMKRIDTAVSTAVEQAAADKFDATPYVGTLANEGVGLSSFHDYESKLPAGLQDELKALQTKIISGEIKVTSPSSPK
ncbi:BMP family ABC transporter substrate-binding protein [Microbacterium sp. VKM Ac-2870]|uniref:BMP family lipoprotein n=1 Tax=Microbacterium sp. VKM Ac-2870 TaxID=2783825 RepID=UPI00188D3A8D|nr:BMP family ABC transporter substrate-binding protein [Microbacterium sp. VKM Ac-2870]MBF4561627.1 BMP family ABC transporter substrate-binding protein [Microbacterium sp. VKM Ac-2870]